MPLVARVDYLFFCSTSICRLNLSSQQSQAHRAHRLVRNYGPPFLPPPPRIVPRYSYALQPKCNGLVNRAEHGRLEIYTFCWIETWLFSVRVHMWDMGYRSGAGTICCHFTSWFRYKHTATTTAVSLCTTFRIVCLILERIYSSIHECTYYIYRTITRVPDVVNSGKYLVC